MFTFGVPPAQTPADTAAPTERYSLALREDDVSDDGGPPIAGAPGLLSLWGAHANAEQAPPSLPRTPAPCRHSTTLPSLSQERQRSVALLRDRAREKATERHEEEQGEARRTLEASEAALAKARH